MGDRKVTDTIEEPMPDTHVRQVGRRWSNAFPTTLYDTRTLERWMFGHPEIRCDNRGWGRWEKVARNAKFVLGTDLNRQFRHGPWAVHLNGGAQAGGEDWASIHVPVNDMPLTDLKKLLWTYYKFVAGTSHIGAVAPNIVISTRNPNDPDERADISQQASHGAAVTAGWHDDTVVPSTTAYLFWYGNGVTSDLTEGSLYTLKQFQEDKAFKNHVIYRIALDYGYWGATRSTGDVWIGTFQINDEHVLLGPTEEEERQIAEEEAKVFGEPSVIARNNGDAVWSRPGISPYFQKSATGWLANLYGGVQSAWDDFAALYVPVNEIPVPNFNTARWSWYQTEAESFGLNMVIWVHDPYDPDKRAEITQLADIATLEKGAGWNAHELNQTTDQFYFYGENTTNTNLTAGPPNYYGWDDFQADELFNTWVVYRVSFEWGWQSGDNEFKDVWVADIKLNNQQIQLKPDSGGSGRIGHRRYEVLSGDVDKTLAPKTPFRLLSLSVHVDNVPVTAELLTLTVDSILAGATDAAHFDAVILSEDMFIGSRTSLFVPFGEGYDFGETEEIDIFQTNGNDDDWGIVLTYQTVFGD